MSPDICKYGWKKPINIEIGILRRNEDPLIAGITTRFECPECHLIHGTEHQGKSKIEHILTDQFGKIKKN